MSTRWHVVARSEELIGAGPLAVETGGLRFALLRLGGALFAVEDQCPHMRHPLSRGIVRDDRLFCSWHNWEFDLLQQQRWVQPETRCVSYPVRERDGMLEIAFDPDDLPDPPGGFPRGGL